ncbi:MAG: hypothetical protein AAGJ10_18650 [Bacteroidota bacterium]
MTDNQHQAPHKPVFEALDMSVTDALRYLKGGFEAPVRDAIAQHVEHDNAAQVELAAARALQMQGQHVMAWHMEDEEANRVLIDEATMAAYLDGALEPAEAAAVEAQLAASQTMYRQMSETVWETTTPMPEGMAAPVAYASAQKRMAEPTAMRPAVKPARWSQVRRWLETAVGHAWRGPAIGFAMGALAMFAVFGGWPSSDTLVILPGTSQVDDTGIMMSGAMETTLPVLELQLGQGATLQWAEVEGAEYAVEVMQSGAVVHTQAVAGNTWSLSEAALTADADVTLSVQATFATGGVMPVTSVRIVWAE